MIFLIGCRQPAHERGKGEDLVALTELRILEQIDDFDAVASGQVLVADLPQIGERADRFRSLSGDVEAEVEHLVAHVISPHEPLAVRRQDVDAVGR